jgi:DNA ligase-1
MADFPTLYGEATTGKAKQWSIRVFERASASGSSCGVIETTFGYVDGKLQTNEKVISEGKNIGKKNETTPLQQAINEARSSWTKKKESGYSPADDDDAVEDGDSSTVSAGARGKGVDDDVPSPMLAHDYNKRGKSIKFPCFVQRKFDGTRCVGMPNKGLFSRNRKRYPHLEHILEELNRLPETFVLDGELYSDELTFQEIVGLVKRETLKKGDDEKQKKIKFHVYDMIRDDMTYDARRTNLLLMFRQYKFKYIVPVATELCESEDKMKEMHSKYVAEGYEGIMLRNKGGAYKGSRSADLQKFKEFFDAEYEIVNYEEGKGLEEGCVIWTCKTPDGKTFSCRPRGTREERTELYLNGDDYIGKMLTIRYQEMTDSNIPRFPVGITFRDYE